MALVEHEVAEAVKDRGGGDGVMRLHHVRMVSDDGICINLYHDTGRGMRGFIFSDSGGQPLDGSMAYIRFSFRSQPNLYREGNGVEE